MPQCLKYQIKKGDTIYSLARKYGTTIEEILSENEDIEPTNLQEGTIICLPKSGVYLQEPYPSMPKPEIVPQYPTTSYTVVQEDTLESIAKKTGLSIPSILFANPDLNPGELEVGSVIIIPSKSTPIPGSTAYIVKADESLLDILKKYDLSYGRLKIFNTNTDLSKLKSGDIIFIPEILGPKVNSCKMGSYSYMIKPDDTIEKIAQTFNISVGELLESNAFKQLSELTPGKIICLPMKDFDDVDNNN